MSDKDSTSYLRDFKLGIITGEREINPYIKIILLPLYYEIYKF